MNENDAKENLQDMHDVAACKIKKRRYKRIDIHSTRGTRQLYYSNRST